MNRVILCLWRVVLPVLFMGPTTHAGDLERRHPLEGTWRLTSFKIDDAESFNPAPKDETELMLLTTSKVVWLVYDNKTNHVRRGVGGDWSAKGDFYEHTIRYIIGSATDSGPKGILGRTYKSRWALKNGKLHVVGENPSQKTERIWERVK